MRARGLFITFEGGEGAGKSTQARLLRERLEADGHDVVLTREPGGTAIGDAIRSILLGPVAAQMEPLTELMLYCAARAQHVLEIIQPALDRGAIVVCDRFSDASRAYQGCGRRLATALVEDLLQAATGGLEPDLTIFLDLPVAEGLHRARERNALRGLVGVEDRFEGETMRFHTDVRHAYQGLAERFADRFVTVPADGLVDQIHESIVGRVEERIAHTKRTPRTAPQRSC